MMGQPRNRLGWSGRGNLGKPGRHRPSYLGLGRFPAVIDGIVERRRRPAFGRFSDGLPVMSEQHLEPFLDPRPADDMHGVAIQAIVGLLPLNQRHPQRR